MPTKKLIETPEKLMEIFEAYKAHCAANLELNGCFVKRLQRWWLNLYRYL